MKDYSMKKLHISIIILLAILCNTPIHAMLARTVPAVRSGLFKPLASLQIIDATPRSLPARTLKMQYAADTSNDSEDTQNNPSTSGSKLLGLGLLAAHQLQHITMKTYSKQRLHTLMTKKTFSLRGLPAQSS